MLKKNSINIKTKGCRKLEYFKALGYDTSKDVMQVKLEHLSVGSREKVEVICDFCGKELIVIWKEYIRNISKVNKYACCKKCGSEKAKITNIEKWGVEHPLQLEEIKKKQTKTNMDKYGVEYLQQSEFFKQKSKITNFIKYGVEHISQLDCNRKRAEEWTSSNDFKEKSKITLLKNYNVDNPSKSLEIQNIIKNNNIKKYGIDHTSKLQEVKEKNKRTNYFKFNEDNITKSEKFRKENFKIAQHQNYISYISNSNSLFKCDCNSEHYFKIYSDNFYKRVESNLPLCTVCYPIDDLKSIKEKQLLEFIKENYKGEILPGYRDSIEIDIYLRDINLGIEFNGLYWHSNEFKENNYHLNKTLYFKERGIKIIHIFEDDWNLKKDIIKSQIKNALGLTETKIFARKCQIKELADVKEFLNTNHIQGNVNSVVKLGLYFNDELVSVMTFDQFEGRKKMEEGGWNLSRFCNKLNYNVIGGASKLLNYFTKKYNTSRIISYADRIWSEGNLYYQLGFKLVSESKPDYKYIIDGVRKHKSGFRKSKLNTQLTESKEMSNKGINKIYDCGKLKFEIQI
jgi:hypothetical protein